MYTDKQSAIISTLLNKWENRNPIYNSIIISDRQFHALRNALAKADYCGHVSYYGITADGREFSICYDNRRSWYTMIFQSTAAEIAVKREREDTMRAAKYDHDKA